MAKRKRPTRKFAAARRPAKSAAGKSKIAAPERELSETPEPQAATNTGKRRPSAAASRPRRSAPRGARKRASASEQDNVTLLRRELEEARQQQAATADVLKVISRSTFDLQAVLDTLVQSAMRLCDAEAAHIFRRNRSVYQLAACCGYSREYEEYMRRQQIAPARNSLIGRTALEGRTVHIPDTVADPEYDWPEAQELGGWRTMLGIPLLREGDSIGVLSVTRSRVEPFTDKQIALLTSFADQAVIAIENMRLFNETKEALERQTATAEILSVISSSPTDTQPVFDAIVESGLKLFSDAAISIALPDGDKVRAVAVAESDPARAETLRRFSPFPLTRDYMHGTAILDRRVVDVPDAENAPAELETGARNFLASGYRAVTIMPMMRGDVAIGTLSVVRLAPGPLSDKQLAVLKTFAAQAVIAIENTRLLNELRESLQQQTATSQV
jgi:two-component system NtrC family sensor kinase